jgi:anti-anti-sigma factor
MTNLATLEEEWHEDVPVARVHGELDASNVAEMGDRLRAMLSNRSLGIVVDLSGTTYLDSAGINVLFALAEEMRGHQQRLGLVVGERSPIARVVSLTGLDRLIPVRPTRPEALTATRAEEP